MVGFEGVVWLWGVSEGYFFSLVRGRRAVRTDWARVCGGAESLSIVAQSVNHVSSTQLLALHLVSTLEGFRVLWSRAGKLVY